MSDTDIAQKDPSRGTNREKILRATLRLISLQGVDKVTHRAVASLAGVSPGTTTYHFASREDLVQEAFELYMDDYQRGLVKSLTSKPLTTADDIVGFLSSVTSLDVVKGGLESIEYEMVMFASRNEAMSVRVAAWSRMLESWLSEPLERLGVARPLEAARVLVALSRGCEFEVMAKGQSIPLDQFQRRIRQVLGGTGPV